MILYTVSLNVLIHRLRLHQSPIVVEVGSFDCSLDQQTKGFVRLAKRPLLEKIAPWLTEFVLVLALAILGH